LSTSQYSMTQLRRIARSISNNNYMSGSDAADPQNEKTDEQ